MSKIENGTSVLIVGPGADARARKVVEDLLGVSNVEFHPDLFVVDATDGAGVDEAEEIIRRSSLLPVNLPYTVVFIKRMDKVTVQGQNKLLKTIEEVEHVRFVMTAERDVLDTIKSRVRVITLSPMSFEQFKSVTNASVPLYYVKKGDPDSDYDEDLLAIYEKVYSAVKNRNVRLLFDALHLTDEKDKNNFFLIFKLEIKRLYSLIVSAQMESGFVGEEVDIIKEHLKWCESVSYTKDNFFECMAALSMCW